MLGGQLQPDAALREAGPAVVRRLVLGDHPQLAHLGLERVRADDRVDPVGQRDHLGHPGALLAGHEVVPDPGAQVLSGPHVERAAGRVAEDVDPWGVRQVLGEVPLAPLRLADLGGEAAQLVE